jgi:hypothetical protein
VIIDCGTLKPLYDAILYSPNYNISCRFLAKLMLHKYLS